MEIEIRNRKAILPESTVFDLDKNAVEWTFILPETVQGRAVSGLTGRLAVKSNAREEAVFVNAEREENRFRVVIPAGLFTGATAAEVQFSLLGEDFAWYTEMEQLSVVRCLDPLGEAAYLPGPFEMLETAQRETLALLNGVIAGETPVGRAKADEQGNAIAETYATKEELSAAQAENAETYATKESFSSLQEEAAETYATKEELSAAQAENAETYATKESLSSLQEEAAETYATKEEVAQEKAALLGEAQTYTDFGAVEGALTDAESGNEALLSYCKELDKNAVWYCLDYVDFFRQEAAGVGSAAVLLRERLEEIKGQFKGIGRPSVLIYGTPMNNLFYAGSSLNLVSGINYYYYQHGDASFPVSLNLADVQDVNIHGFVLRGSEGMGTALHLVNCTNVRVERCALTNYRRGAVFLQNCKDIVIEDTGFSGGGENEKAEIVIKDTTENVTALTIRHCRFKDNGLPGVNLSGVTNPNLSVVLDHVYFQDGRKITEAGVTRGKERLYVTATEDQLPEAASDTQDGLMSKEQYAYLTELSEKAGVQCHAFGEVGMYEEYPVYAQVQYVRTAKGRGLLNVSYRLPEIPETEERYGHISQAKLNSLMGGRFGFYFDWKSVLSGTWFSSAEKESLIAAACCVGVYSGYLEPVSVLADGTSMGLSLKQTGGALFRMMNIAVEEIE